jgi:hypothetical protein
MTVEVSGGVTAADRLVLNPPDSITDDVEVRVHNGDAVKKP